MWFLFNRFDYSINEINDWSRIRRTHTMLNFFLSKITETIMYSIALYRGAALVLWLWRNVSTSQVTGALFSAKADECRTTHFRSSM